MSSFTNTILTLLLGWLSTLLNAARDFISSDSSTAVFDFFRSNWRVLFLVLCIIGFALDKIVYLIRWRPRPIWFRRRQRRMRYNPPPQEAYDLPAYDDDTSAIPTSNYAPAPEYAYSDADAAPTMQYQMQPQNGPSPDPLSVSPPYTTPYYAPEALQHGDDDGETQLRWDEMSQGHTFAPADDPQRYAFGMAPSFGSAQSEPVYHYHRDAAQSFAPPQHSQEYDQAGSYAPPYPPEQMPGEMEAQPQAYPQPSPYFRPFSDRGEQTFSPPKTRRFGTVARKARTLLSADEAYESLTYKDLHPTVDVSKAFHAPVYPARKPEGDN